MPARRPPGGSAARAREPDAVRTGVAAIVTGTTSGYPSAPT